MECKHVWENITGFRRCKICGEVDVRPGADWDARKQATTIRDQRSEERWNRIIDAEVEREWNRRGG